MKLIVSAILLLLLNTVYAQQAYWQQHLRYNIQATLNDKENTISASETIIYKNNSTSTLDFIWFHIWPNAYKNDSTALMKQILNDTTRKKKAENFGTGFIDGLSFSVNGKQAKTEPHPDPSYIDIIKVLLPEPLKPGDSITIRTPFKVKLPPYFSRSGYADGEFMACQWYPKPAVFDKDGWHPFPYLDMGEFYSEYADYDVSITLPAEYVVGATGVLQTTGELAAYKSIGAKNAANRNGKPILYSTKNKNIQKTLRYQVFNVPDFAWFADKNFVVQYDTAHLPSGKVIDAFTYYHNKEQTIWKNSIDYVKDAVEKYSGWIGEYEYPLVQAVEGPKNNSSGGMEYPTITLITSPDAKVETLDGVIAHEVGHNWFMSMLGSNERMHTWMDEGLNTYYQFRYEAEKYRSNSIFGDAIPDDIKKLPADKFLEIIYGVVDQNVPMKAAMDIPADAFTSSEEYGIVSYVKTALWMYMLESNVGREKVDSAFKFYFTKWHDKHPQPEDLKTAFETALEADLSKFFEMTKKEGKLE